QEDRRAGHAPCRLLLPHIFLFFFFKQKTAYEIRTVTGVQTCALPIYDDLNDSPGLRWNERIVQVVIQAILEPPEARFVGQAAARSEERRVGKESRCLWWAEE